VDALPIIIALDVGEQFAPGLVPGRPSSLVDELDLEGMEEALRRGIIVTTVYSMVGMTKSAPVRMPVGQRVVMVFRRV
jgi:hypothetical protein